MAEIIRSRILEAWRVPPIGGDEPGMVKGEMPPKAQEIWEQIQKDHESGRIATGTSQGVTLLGPIENRDGKRVVVVYKVEYTTYPDSEEF